VAVANTLVYYDMAKNIAEERFIVQNPGLMAYLKGALVLLGVY